SGSSILPRRLVWFHALASLPSSQSEKPASASRRIAQPSARGPRTSHRNTGTPSRRPRLKALGIVQIRSSEVFTVTQQTLTPDPARAAPPRRLPRPGPGGDAGPAGAPGGAVH